MYDHYARRGDASLAERKALAGYNRHKAEFGLPREVRSVHYQLPSTRADDASKRLGARQMLAARPAHKYVPALRDASAEYARPAQPLRARSAEQTGGTHDKPTAAALGFGSAVPRAGPRGMETTKARELRRWRERVALETRAQERQEVPADLDDLARYLPAPGRAATATAYDMVNGLADAATPHCTKCGQDRFYCPHRARAAPLRDARYAECTAGATSHQAFKF